MKRWQATFFMGLLMVCFAGSSYAAEKKEGKLGRVCRKVEPWLLTTAGVVGVPTFGFFSLYMLREMIFDDKDKVGFILERLACLGTCFSGFLFSAWACVSGIEELSKNKKEPKKLLKDVAANKT